MKYRDDTGFLVTGVVPFLFAFSFSTLMVLSSHHGVYLFCFYNICIFLALFSHDRHGMKD